jgi:hypothetical protein
MKVAGSLALPEKARYWALISKKEGSQKAI